MTKSTINQGILSVLMCSKGSLTADNNDPVNAKSRSLFANREFASFQ